MANQFSFLFLITLFLFCSSCNVFERNDNELVSEKILNNPPFKAISDSIRDFKDDVNLLIKRADLLLQKKYPELASRDYEKAWNLKPGESIGLQLTASLFMAGKESQAIELLNECIQKFPANPEFRRRLGEAYLQTGQVDEALQQYNTIIQEDPANFEAWYEKGMVLAEMRDTAKAIEAVEEAYSIQPLQMFGIALANLYAETKNEKTISLCNELISRDSSLEFIDPIYLKGVYFANIDAPKNALEQFEICIKRDWKFIEAYIEKGIVLYDQKQVDEALKTFELAATVSNTYADAYYWIGKCYETKGLKKDAINNYYKALSLDRNFAEAAESLQRLKGQD